MAELTKEQYDQLSRDASYMKQSGMSQEDVDAYLDERYKQLGAAALPTERPTGQTGLAGSQTAALFAGPAIGGFYGAQLSAGRNVLPFLGGTGRAITQFGGEALGIAGGDVAGRYVAGVPQDPRSTTETALGGAALGSLYRGGVQAGGYYGNLPESVTQGAAEPMRIGKVPVPVPNLKSISRAGPHTVAEVKAGISPEMELTERASKAARAAKRTLTTQRMEKELAIRKADATGVRIPVAPVQDALRDNLPMAEAEKISDFRLLRSKINQAIAMLDEAGKSSGGTVAPSKIDTIIRKVLRPKVYSATGKPSNSLFAQALADAEDSATHLLNDALPGDIAKMNAEITQKLNATESAVALFGDPDKAGVSARLSNAFGRGNELSAKALSALSEHDKSLVDDAFNLYQRRNFAGDIREAPAAGGAYNKFFGRPVEMITRSAAPFQRFVGGASGGAYEAFYNQMNQRAKTQ